MSDSAPFVAQPCPTDGPIGAAIVGLASLLLIVATYVATVAWTVFETYATILSGAEREGLYMGSSRTPEAPPNPALLLFALFMIGCGVLFAAGLGVRRGQKWAFGLSIFLFSLFLLLGNGPAVFGAGVVLYCCLRLLGVIRPVVS